MKLNTLIILSLLAFLAQVKVINAQLDFKYDDEVYKTLYPEDLRDFLNDNPGTLLIDVRSPGEFDDTSDITRLKYRQTAWRNKYSN